MVFYFKIALYKQKYILTNLYFVRLTSESNSSARVAFLSLFVNLPEKKSDADSTTVPTYIRGQKDRSNG